jgi:hypothetical protein
VAQAFQQRPRGRLLLGPGTRRTSDRPTATPRAEQLQVFGGAICGDGCQALITGQVRLVDEVA